MIFILCLHSPERAPYAEPGAQPRGLSKRNQTSQNQKSEIVSYAQELFQNCMAQPGKEQGIVLYQYWWSLSGYCCVYADRLMDL